MTNETAIGERLDAFRKVLGITQKAFAQQLGVKPGFLNDVIKGRKGIGATILINVAKAYENLNLRWLFTGEGEMYAPVNTYALPPPELPPGVSEGIKIEYLKREGQLEAMQRVLADHERRLRDLEGK